MSAPDQNTPASAGDDGHEESHLGTYVTVFLTLAFLTVVEVFVPEVYASEWNRHTKMLLLSGLAISKAIMVGMFFMHLKYEKKWLSWIAMMPAYMGVFAILLMLESVYRNVGS
ncbi:MAG: cytochrome c oxidase subunit 4 [Pseudohongiellaceae bacterium]|jgi:cytochrome c oxidase subunit 4